MMADFQIRVHHSAINWQRILKLSNFMRQLHKTNCLKPVSSACTRRNVTGLFACDLYVYTSRFVISRHVKASRELKKNGSCLNCNRKEPSRSLNSSYWQYWRFYPSGIWQPVDWYIITNVSEELTALIFRPFLLGHHKNAPGDGERTPLRNDAFCKAIWTSLDVATIYCIFDRYIITDSFCEWI